MPTREEYRQILKEELDKKSEEAGDGDSCEEGGKAYVTVRRRD